MFFKNFDDKSRKRDFISIFSSLFKFHLLSREVGSGGEDSWSIFEDLFLGKIGFPLKEGGHSRAEPGFKALIGLFLNSPFFGLLTFQFFPFGSLIPWFLNSFKGH